MAKIKKSVFSGIRGRYANRNTRSTGLPVLLGAVTLDTVYSAFQDMIFTKDIDGRITSANESFANYAGMKIDDIIGITAYDMKGITPEAAEQIAIIDAQVMRTRESHLKREWILFANGSRIFTEQVTTPLVREGEAIGVLVIIRDLTELKVAMDEVKKQNEILETIGLVSALMLEPDINAFTNSIYEAMEIIAKGISAHRIDIWRQRGAGEDAYYTLEYDWQRDRTIGNLFEGVTDDERTDIINADKRVIPFIRSLLDNDSKPINGIVGEMPKAVQEMFRKNGIETAKSALIMPIILSDEYWGFIGAFDVEQERVFSENEELLLRSSRRMIASAMTRMEITKDLMHQTDRLRYELVTKRDFFARMSHEIRTPLNAILGMTELALREKMSNTANEHIMTVKQTGMNLLTIVNDILDFSKIESGNMELIAADYALSSLIHDIVSIIRMRLAYTRIRFIVDIDSHLPCALIGDEGKIRQILINLLSNAVKYTQKGFIRLTVNGKIQNGDMIELGLTVTDSGKGIKEEDQKKLFRDYIQVDQEKNAGIEGVGLGLSITNGLVTAMNGTISLTSEYGVGSEFSVTLPQKVSNYERIARVNEPKKKTTLIYERRKLYIDTLVGSLENLGIKCDVVDNTDELFEKLSTGSYAYLMGSIDLMVEIKYTLQELTETGNEFQVIGIAEYGDEADSVWRTLSTPIHTISLANVFNGEENRYVYTEDDMSIRFSAPEAKVLIVDDIATNLKVAAGLLSIFDVEIETCNSGEQAIDMVRDTAYDIVFMDHKMPGMDGVEATQAIRGLGSDVPIVALTANVMANMREMFLNAGFNDFIGKPIDTVTLAGVMRRWIPKTKQRRYISTQAPIEDTASCPDTGITFTIPGVDVDKGFRTAGSRMDVYLDILSTFHDEASERLVQLYEYNEAGNTRMYTIGVHALKGALANIGAIELSKLAAKIEAAGERKDADFIEKNSEHFVSGISRLLTNIKAVLTETAKSAGEGKQSSAKETERFVSTLKDLRDAIVDMNAGTMNRALERLLSDAPTEASLSAVRAISKHILMAEYDDAEQKVETLISEM